MFKRLSGLGVLALCACGTAGEVRVGADQGIPAIKGNTEFTLGNYTCGQPIAAQGYTVTTTVKGTDCEFSFDQVVEVIRDSDYKNIPDLMGSSNLVQAIELEVKQLKFSDAATGTALSFDTYVKSAALKIDGQQVADKSTLATLPTTVRLEGAALTNIKSKVDARLPASVHATAIMLVPSTPKPPDRLKVDYDAQPTLILGAGKINLGM